MPAPNEALQQQVECPFGLEICKKLHRLPCEHFFYREPCLQNLLNAEQPTCPMCYRDFSEADFTPFRFLLKLLTLMSEANQCGEVSLQESHQIDTVICPICVQQVETSLRRSDHFSKLVCADCWRTGGIPHQLTIEETTDGEIMRTSIIVRENELQKSQREEKAVCPNCVRWVETPLQRSEHFPELVCADCWSTSEMLLKFSIQQTNMEEIGINGDTIK
ncbi:unnamed protein product [Dibothriocephalus latus]|uniref:Uncharacterized protein n=1 Tax=Dibothriocephalus latus TaxID=60516 RepID=A0A3P7NHU5_DIBLA|nr:unnamed protein product [Dibothriocephalus latus]